MAKIRLNQDKRDILYKLAVKVVAATPIDPAIENRKKKAIKNYNRLFTSLVKEALAIKSKEVPVSDLTILEKYNCTSKDSSGIRFVDLDTRNMFSVTMFNSQAWIANHPVLDSLSIGEKAAYYIELANDTKAVNQKLPIKPPYQTYIFTASKALIKINNKLHMASTELEIASAAESELRSIIITDFNTLINSMTTFEDVCEVWPEAKLVTDRIIGTSKQISLMSSEAVDRIQANMAIRNIK